MRGVFMVFTVAGGASDKDSEGESDSAEFSFSGTTLSKTGLETDGSNETLRSCGWGTAVAAADPCFETISWSRSEVFENVPGEQPSQKQVPRWKGHIHPFGPSFSGTAEGAFSQ